MARRSWVKLPSGWIEGRGLVEFQWKPRGSSETAALMVLIAIAHHASLEEGIAYLTYDNFEDITHLSRTKIGEGLARLKKLGLIAGDPDGHRSIYQLADYDPAKGWTMLPARGLYSAAGGIAAFADFRLRSRSELDALKAYLAFAARRDRRDNRAHMTYEQIEEYAGIPQARIKTALSILTSGGLLLVDQLPSRNHENAMAHAYRLAHLNPTIHQGTTGRGTATPRDDLSNLFLAGDRG